jgi:hypothetical protein
MRNVVRWGVKVEIQFILIWVLKGSEWLVSPRGRRVQHFQMGYSVLPNVMENTGRLHSTDNRNPVVHPMVGHFIKFEYPEIKNTY